MIIKLIFPDSDLPGMPTELEIQMPCVPRVGETLRAPHGDTIAAFRIETVTYTVTEDDLESIEVELAGFNETLAPTRVGALSSAFAAHVFLSRVAQLCRWACSNHD